jgi:hypothetical protein
MSATLNEHVTVREVWTPDLAIRKIGDGDWYVIWSSEQGPCPVIFFEPTVHFVEEERWVPPQESQRLSR